MSAPKREYIVAVPTPMGGAFAMNTGRGLTSEYPNAVKLKTLREAKNLASWHENAQVYTTTGYEQGDGPVWRVK
jgi:hypothetical protein